MREHDMSQQIKEIRKHYGLSQQAFARLLGIGEASITRYEKGIAPTKANANLIRATMIPAFMAGCLERDGDALTPKQRASVEKIVYAEVTFDEGGDDGNLRDNVAAGGVERIRLGHHGADLQSTRRGKAQGK